MSLMKPNLRVSFSTANSVLSPEGVGGEVVSGGVDGDVPEVVVEDVTELVVAVSVSGLSLHDQRVSAVSESKSVLRFIDVSRRLTGPTGEACGVPTNAWFN